MPPTIPTQLCTRSLRTASPAVSATPLPVVPPTRLRRPFSTTKSSLSVPPAQDDGASKPLIRRVVLGESNQIIAHKPPVPPKLELTADLALLRGVVPAVEELLRTTPFRISAPTTLRTRNIRNEFGGEPVPEYTRPGIALDRAYLFATPEAAFAFVHAVETRIAARRLHYPQWGGCGRRVYVRWKSRGYLENNKSQTGLSMQDVESAFETEEMARDIASRDRRGGGAAVRCDDWFEQFQKTRASEVRKKGSKRNDFESFFPVAFWPEERQGERGQLTTDHRLMVWNWIRKRAWSPTVSDEPGTQGQEFYPAWSAMFGGALISRLQWTLHEDGGMGRLVVSNRSLEKMSKNSSRWARELDQMLGHHERGRLLIRMMWRAARDATFRGIVKGSKGVKKVLG